MSGVDGETAYLVHTNLIGAYNCLELARRDRRLRRLPLDQPRLPGRAQCELALEETETRFEIAAEQELPGVSPAGISEDFPLDWRPHPLRRDQAGRRAPDRGVPLRSRACRR